MLEINKLAFHYDQSGSNQTNKNANDNSDAKPSGTLGMEFSLNADAGEILSVIGSSGSGKTTLLHLIAGFLKPDSGKISIDNVYVQSLPIAQRPLSIVFQSHNLFPHLDLWTNIALGISPTLKFTDSQRNDIDNAINKLGLSGLQKRLPGQLSGGQQQRVALARALVRQHKLLLLDEPFAALGPAQRREMLQLLKELARQKSMVVVMVSHQPADALFASDRTAFIDNGKVYTLDKTDVIINQRTDDCIRNYLGQF